MSPLYLAILLPVGALYAYAAGRLVTGVLRTSRIEALVPIMALSALLHLVASSLVVQLPTLALLAFWSSTHLAALPFVARTLRPKGQ